MNLFDKYRKNIKNTALILCTALSLSAVYCPLSYAEQMPEAALEDPGAGADAADENADDAAVLYSIDNAASDEEDQSEDTGVSVELIDESESAKDEAGGVSMSLSYGFHNIAKSGRMLPFYVDIENNTADNIDGSLVIEVQGSTETERDDFEEAMVRYSFDVSLPAGEHTKIRNTISIAETGSPALLTLYDRDGNEIASESTEVSLQPGAGAELLIGVLSDSPERLGYFKNINIPNTVLRTRTVELDPANMPETVSGLEQLDIVLISDFDPAELSDAAKAAIKSWTEAGGVLLIGTGHYNQAARELGRGIKDLSIGAAGERTVNMGLKYSKTNPDDAALKLDVCSVFAADGIQVMQSDDIAMLTSVPSGSGIIGIAAYDFCDIEAFCSEEIEYTEDVLKNILGSSRLMQLANSAGDNNELYMRADELVGIADPDRLPSAAFYILFCLIYLGLIGGGIYFYLRMRGLSIFYHAFVPIAAFMSAIVLWLFSSGLRNDGISFDYAVIRELHDGYASDTGFMKISAASLKSFSLDVPSEYEVHPIVHEAGSTDEAGGIMYYLAPETSDEADKMALIEIKNSENAASISAGSMKPFAGILTEYSARIHGDGRQDGIDTDISCFDDRITGSVTNNTGHELNEAVLMMYGRLVKIGDLAAGETVDLTGRKVMDCPVGDSALVAAEVSDINKYDKGSTDYVRALRRERLLKWYMDNSLCGYFPGARLIAFADGIELLEKVRSDSQIESNGIMLISSQADAKFTKGGLVWNACLETEPKLVSGDYDAAANTAAGTCVLEYTLGNDINVTELKFKALDNEFESGDNGIFTGAVSFYNYESGCYELMNGDIYSGIAADRLIPYLSPGNTITVRYTVDDAAIEKRKLYLPVPYAAGTKRR